MKKIGESHYRGVHDDQEFTVFKVVKTNYYSRSLSRANIWGSTQTANSRKETWWEFKVGEYVTEGYGSKKQAVAAATDYIDMRKRYAAEDAAAIAVPVKGMK